MPQWQIVWMLQESLSSHVVGAEKLTVSFGGLDHSQPFARAMLRLRRHA
jgi:hypothetical protein